MKVKFTMSISVLLLYVFLSCKKEKSCEGCLTNNKPPIAIAGPDQTVTLPTDSVLLDGSASSDPDGRISKWLWTKISGPASFVIATPSDSITKLRSLIAGKYELELKVIDNSGIPARDTVTIIVNNPMQPNRPPIANAGADQIITLPNSSVNLDGSSSADPDNNITSYQWTKISGPSSFSFVNSNAAQTQVTNLLEGNYQFELKVTDAGALFSKDTMQVIVKPASLPPANTCEPLNRSIVNVQLVPFGNLSIARSNMAVASAGTKILFAGGLSLAGTSTRVDIYDTTTNTWSIAELSIPRELITTVSAGTKIFFAGGYVNPFGTSTRVDIYDVSTNIWSTAELSVPRMTLATAAIGNKVFFAGGENYSSGTNTPLNTVDIYDISSGRWSTAKLSQARYGLTATTAGNKIYFAGGWNNIDGPTSNVIDVYDGLTGNWTTASLVSPKAYHTAIALEDQIFWAGGATLIDLANEIDNTCQVEIRNVNTQTSTFTNLSQPGSSLEAFVKNNRILYLPEFDIYDPVTGVWSIGHLNQSIPEGGVFISVNNTIYVAGGSNGNYDKYYNQIWKLEF